MRRSSENPTPTTEGLIPYIAIAGFALTFWAATILLWSIAFSAEVMRNVRPPDFFWTLLGSFLPLIGYGALMRATPSTESRFSLATYFWMQVFGLIVWVLSVWLWSQAYLWSANVFDWSFLLVFLFQVLPYWFWVRSMIAPRAPMPAPANAPARPRLLTGDDWLKWMGKGEPERGVLIVLAAIFWTMLYWYLPRVQEMELIQSIPIWGLLTILMLAIIRAVSKRSGPSGEVSAPPDPKSKTPGK